MIERVLKDSRAIDTEGLCIKAEEKVWSIRTDIHILDDGGNILDCACIAAIAALLHFRRPEVSLHGDEVTVVGFPLPFHITDPHLRNPAFSLLILVPHREKGPSAPEHSPHSRLRLFWIL